MIIINVYIVNACIFLFLLLFNKDEVEGVRQRLHPYLIHIEYYAMQYRVSN